MGYNYEYNEWGESDDEYDNEFEEESGFNWFELERSLSDEIDNAVYNHVKHGDIRLKFLSPSDLFNQNVTNMKLKGIKDSEEIDNFISEILHILDIFMDEYGDYIYYDKELGNKDAENLLNYYFNDYSYDTFYRCICDNIDKHYNNQTTRFIKIV